MVQHFLTISGAWKAWVTPNFHDFKWHGKAWEA